MNEVIQTSWHWLILIGLVGGTIGGMLGVGGGVIVVPALVLGLALDQKVAQGTSLAVMVPMALMGATRYALNPDIKLSWTVIACLIPCALIGVNIGSSIAAMLPVTVLRRIFAVFVVGVGIRMLCK